MMEVTQDPWRVMMIAESINPAVAAVQQGGKGWKRQPGLAKECREWREADLDGCSAESGPTRRRWPEEHKEEGAAWTDGVGSLLYYTF